MQAVLSKEDMGQQLESCTPAKHLDQLAAFVTEHIEVAAVRVSRERFLHQQDPASACRDACRCGQSQSIPARPTQWGSPRRPSANAATAAFSVAASTVPVIRIRAPAANSISIAPPPTRIHHFKPFELDTAPIAVHRDSSQQHGYSARRPSPERYRFGRSRVLATARERFCGRPPQGAASQIRPMMDWSESSSFQSIRRRRVAMCAPADQEKSHHSQRERTANAPP